MWLSQWVKRLEKNLDQNPGRLPSFTKSLGKRVETLKSPET